MRKAAVIAQGFLGRTRNRGGLDVNYNKSPFMESLREEGRVQGRAEGRAEGRGEGRVEGRAEGRAEARIEVLLEILEQKPSGPVPSDLRGIIERTADVTRLRQWSSAALKASSIEEFRTASGI
jgi:hypothetical protein